MDHLLNLREPVAAWSHGAWLALSLPGALLLWRRARGNRGRQVVLLAYVVCLALCASASTLYHGMRLPDDQLAVYLLCDHIGIYLLIAGTYTPIACILMRGRWRQATLALTWLAAALGVGLHLAWHDLPNGLTTGLYLAMGWGSLVCFIELARIVPRKVLRPITLGGALYSVGAVFHVLGWPVVWPGVVGAHEIFHVLVVAGSLAHYQFIFQVVARWGSLDDPAASAGRMTLADPTSLGPRAAGLIDPILTRLRGSPSRSPSAALSGRAFAWAWAKSVARPPGRSGIGR